MAIKLVLELSHRLKKHMPPSYYMWAVDFGFPLQT